MKQFALTLALGAILAGTSWAAPHMGGTTAILNTSSATKTQNSGSTGQTAFPSQPVFNGQPVPTQPVFNGQPVPTHPVFAGQNVYGGTMPTASGSTVQPGSGSYYYPSGYGYGGYYGAGYGGYSGGSAAYVNDNPSANFQNAATANGYASPAGYELAPVSSSAATEGTYVSSSSGYIATSAHQHQVIGPVVGMNSTAIVVRTRTGDVTLWGHTTPSTIHQGQLVMAWALDDGRWTALTPFK